MKKLISLFGITIACITFTSCTNEVSQEVRLQNAERELGISDLSLIKQQIDSINACAFETTRSGLTQTDATIDFDKLTQSNSMATTVADGVGYIFGHYAGKHIGASLGATLGNPATAMVGYLIGRRYGGAICSKLCSFAAAYITNSNCSSETYTPYIVRLEIDYQTIKFDSIGMTHNETMKTMLKDKSLYKNSANQLNYDKAFADCIEILESNTDLANSFSNDTTFREDAIAYAKKISLLSKDCFNGKISVNAMINKQKAIMEEQFNIIDKNLANYVEIARSIAIGCIGKDHDATEKYAKDLEVTINKSNLRDEDKALIAGTANIILNSRDCWNAQVEDQQQ